MSLIEGISTDWLPFDKRVKNEKVLCHLAFNSNKEGYFFTEDGRLRGYFLTRKSLVLSKLRENYGLTLKNQDIDFIIGFMYGFIYKKCDIIPLDIEFALGYNREDNTFKINILDFGMTFDVQNDENNSRDIHFQNTEDDVKSELSYDIYGDLETNDNVIDGWNSVL